ncbi:MAG: TonB-dependent receptor [Methylococcales bacterium]|nr:TonB-dependent receptor [Methylococcales bacterium]
MDSSGLSIDAKQFDYQRPELSCGANGFRTNGYIRPDLMAQYHWNNLDLRFNVENLFDKRYVASSVYDDTVVQGNRLFFKFTVSAKFH